MTVSFVVAVAENRVMGADNRLPWHLPADLKRFKALTLGKPIVMGRKTYDSIGRALPGRTNIVVSRQPGLALEGCIVVSSLAAALAAAGDAPEIMVIGGGALFHEALPLAQRIYLTRVHAAVAGDILFPQLDPAEWREVFSEPHAADEQH